MASKSKAAVELLCFLVDSLDDLRGAGSEHAAKAIAKHGPTSAQVAALVKVDDFLRDETERVLAKIMDVKNPVRKG